MQRATLALLNGSTRMARREIPPAGYLDQFRNPIWRLADLSLTSAESIVCGRRGGFEFTVLELRHRILSMMGEAGYEVTTVFIVKLGRRSDTWQNNLVGPDGAKVWLDDDLLYLARIAVETRVEDWDRLLNAALDAARRATDAPTAIPLPTPRISTKSNATDVFAWIVVGGLAPGFVSLSGLSLIAWDTLRKTFGWCYPAAGTDAWASDYNQSLFGLSLCLPLLGLFYGLKIIYDYYGHPRFQRRLTLNVVLIAALTAGGLFIAFEHTRLSADEIAKQKRCVEQISR